MGRTERYCLKDYYLGDEDSCLFFKRTGEEIPHGRAMADNSHGNKYPALRTF